MPQTPRPYWALDFWRYQYPFVNHDLVTMILLRNFRCYLLVCSLALAGCGTFRNEQAARVAESDRAVLVYNGPSAGISVSHIDGQNRGIGLYERFELAPGLRTVTVYLNLPGTRSKQLTVEFKAEPAGNYESRYSTSPGKFGIGIWRAWVIDSATRATVSHPSSFTPADVQR
jgi:hypothetical protein